MRNLIVFMLLGISIMTNAQTTGKKFRIGVAGLNHGHVGWILDRADDGDLEITGIAEPDKALAERLLKRYNLPMTLWYPDIESMLTKTSPQAVTAFNATFDHLDVVKACAPKKIHVMVEKPLAVSVAHAKEIQALAQKHNIFVLTNYETTWYGSNLKVEELVKDREKFGVIRKVVIHDGHEGPKEINVGPEFLEWLTDPVKNGGGAIMDFGCYGANLMTWLMKGERPTSVSAVTQTYKPHIYSKVDDEATIIVSYPAAQAIIQASWNWPFGRKDIEVYGERGYVIADRQGSKVKLSAKEQEQFFASPALARPINDPFSYLAAVVRGEIKPASSDLSSLENNVIVLEILEAAKISAKEGKAVELK
jgi:predicted dehydrogenase